ncbi:hypothetical protein [Ectopseudomonas khazarica]|uniref:hypothetical protein n=1 Tax=Ectopseudomonas khazarica TaxID=2502979 RepID=UPI0037C54E2D
MIQANQLTIGERLATRKKDACERSLLLDSKTWLLATQQKVTTRLPISGRQGRSRLDAWDEQQRVTRYLLLGNESLENQPMAIAIGLELLPGQLAQQRLPE